MRPWEQFIDETQKILELIKAGHTWMEYQPVQQGTDKFRSMYGGAGSTQVHLSIDCVQAACWVCAELSVPRAITGNTDHCILMAGKAPCHQNTIAQWECVNGEFTSNVWMGELTHFLSYKQLAELKKMNHMWSALDLDFLVYCTLAISYSP